MRGREKILFAVSFPSESHFGMRDPKRFVNGWAVSPLAATPAVKETIDLIGRDACTEWLDACGVHPPQYGGLWVLSATLGPDPSRPCLLGPFEWLVPEGPEAEALIWKQWSVGLQMRGGTKFDEPKLGSSQWIYDGAML